MKYDKKNQTIALDQKDDGMRIVAKSRRLGESIGFKVFYSDKGFGIEVFSQEEGKRKGTKMIMFDDDEKIFESSYIGIWKLKPSVKRRVKKRFGGKK